MDDKQLLRYSRHLLLPQMDYAGQEKLLNAKVLIIGIGGLGSPAALYLAASGIGEITLVDDDVVELSNLQRQIVHSQSTIGLNKAESAKHNLVKLNSTIKITVISKRLDKKELLTQCKNHDVVLDCTDRFASRFALNQACVTTKSNLVSAAAVGFDGQISSFRLSDNTSPCYQCLYTDNLGEDTLCSENGILSPVVGIMGVLQALETIKILTDVGNTLVGKLLLFDGMNTEFRTVKLNKDPKCKICD